MPLATPVNAEDYTVTIQPEGTDTIVAGDGSDTVIAGYGTDAVTLSGWTNQVIGGLGQDVVTGGSNNTYSIAHLAAAGAPVAMDITDFSVSTNDVLDLTGALKDAGYAAGDTLANFVQVAQSGGNTLVSITDSSSISHLVAGGALF